MRAATSSATNSDSPVVSRSRALTACLSPPREWRALHVCTAVLHGRSYQCLHPVAGAQPCRNHSRPAGDDTVSAPAPAASPVRLVLRLSALDLRPLPEAVPSARLHAKAVLMAWGLRGQAADAELVTSELVTNGVRYAIEDAAGGEPFPVRLRLSAPTDGGT